MVKYRNKYILDGLDAIPDDMLRDLDLAYDVCMQLGSSAECECCGKCCHQPFITVMDDEVERISSFIGMDPYDFVMEYLYREDDRWLLRKDGKCRFLGNDNRCTIWKGRPEICRDFPYMVSKLMSSVYLSIAYPEYKMDLSYMEDDWPCTPGIKGSVKELVERARERRSML